MNWNRKRRSHPGDRLLIAVLVVVLVLMLVAAGPLRDWARTQDLGAALVFDSLPSFCLAVGLGLFVMIMERCRAIVAVATAAGLGSAIELVQLLIPGMQFDLADLVATGLGALIVYPLLRLQAPT